MKIREKNKKKKFFSLFNFYKKTSIFKFYKKKIIKNINILRPYTKLEKKMTPVYYRNHLLFFRVKPRAIDVHFLRVRSNRLFFIEGVLSLG